MFPMVKNLHPDLNTDASGVQSVMTHGDTPIHSHPDTFTYTHTPVYTHTHIHIHVYLYIIYVH